MCYINYTKLIDLNLKNGNTLEMVKKCDVLPITY